MIVGDGPRCEAIEALIEELALQERVSLAGRQNDVVPWLQSLDLFALPSYANEGVPQAIVQAMPDIETDDSLTEELLAFCREHLSRQKVPRSIDYEDELPRLPTGKLYKRLLRDRY